MDGWMNVWMDFNFFIWSPYFGGMLKYFLLKKKLVPTFGGILDVVFISVST